MAIATTPDAAANPKKQKRSDKSPSSNVKKPRASLPAKQKNTLDMWFKKSALKATPEPPAAPTGSEGEASEKAPANDSADSSSDSLPAEPVVELINVTPPVQKKKVINAASSSSKKLVQRRIHINDPCRVCESARTEETSRCELRCLGCDMTVHKKCYDVQSEDPIDDWNCRRCQYILDKKEELKSAKEDATPSTENDSFLLPTHEPLGETHKHHDLHGNSDFATVFQFLKRFRRMGLKVSTDVTLKNLAEALTLPAPNDKFLEELHLRLLVNVEVTINKNHDWTVNLARFLASAEHHPRSTKLDAFITSAAANKKEQSVVGTTVELYAALSTSERVAVLKYVCEAQFDDNEALVERIGDQEGDSLRDEPVGTDSAGCTYWAMEDAPSVLDGTVWVCRSADAKQQQEEEDGSNTGSSAQWETVSDDLETLESFIEWLSLSSETVDLQLWQQFSSGVLKSLVRRNKKQQQSAARLARMPRMLGSASGLDLGSIVGGDDDGSGVRRSTRSRRAVSYRVESEEEEDEEEEANESNGSEEEEEEEDDGEDDEEDQENDDEERPSKRPRRSTQQQREPKRAEAEPSRRSSRLRGGEGDNGSPASSTRATSSSHAAASSSPRRRSDRRVAAEAAASSSGARSSSRRLRSNPRSRGPNSREDSDDKSSSSSDNSNSSDSEDEVEEEEEEIEEDA